jgi:CRP/FNR family transcriptional regulator, dissimilatory nitrate respiration regulator
MDRPVFDLPRYLSLQPLFTDLSAPERERLAQGCLLRRFERGEDIFRVGDPCEEFHVCVTGQVKLYAVSSAGAEKVIDLISPGQSFAEALMM